MVLRGTKHNGRSAWMPPWYRAGKPFVNSWRRHFIDAPHVGHVSTHRHGMGPVSIQTDGHPSGLHRGQGVAGPCRQAPDRVRAVLLSLDGVAGGPLSAAAGVCRRPGGRTCGVEPIIDLDIDDTTCGRSGKHAAYAGYFKDASVSNTLQQAGSALRIFARSK